MKRTAKLLITIAALGAFLSPLGLVVAGKTRTAEAQTQNSVFTFTLTDQGTQLDTNGKYKWTIGLEVAGGTFPNSNVTINIVTVGSNSITVLPSEAILRVVSNRATYTTPALLESGPRYRAIFKQEGTGPNGLDIYQTIETTISTTGTTTNTTSTNVGAGPGGIVQAQSSNLPGDLPSCGLILNGTVMGCVAVFVYHVLFQTTSAIAYITGGFLDFFMHYSIDSLSYSGQNAFIQSGWQLTRDIANIFFIIILIYTALSTILDIGPNPKQVIVNVIIIALLINFSLFFARVIVDSSNIIARIFYDAVEVKDSTGATVPVSLGGEKTISRAIVTQIDPQKIMQPDLFKNADGSTGDDYATSYILITLIATAINLVMIYIFFSVGILFLWRVIGLWIAMIFAPLAFVTYILPETRGVGDFAWKKWLANLTELAFLAPIFSFFLYLILKFAQIKQALPDPNTPGLDYFKKIIFIIIPLLFVAFMLLQAKKLAQKYAGEGGATLNKYAGMAGGFALGAVTGGAALAGRATVGRLGAVVAESGTLKSKAAEKGMGGWLARRTLDMSRGAQTSTFDVRNAKVAGKGLSDIPGTLKLGKGTDMTFKKKREEDTQKELKYATSLEVGPDEKLSRKLQEAKRNGDSEEIKSIEAEIKTENTRRRTEYAKVVEAQNAPMEMIKNAGKGAFVGGLAGTLAGPGGILVGALAGAVGNAYKGADYSSRGAKDAADKIRKGTKAKKKDKDGNEVPESKPATADEIKKAFKDAMDESRGGGTRNSQPAGFEYPGSRSQTSASAGSNVGTSIKNAASMIGGVGVAGAGKAANMVGNLAGKVGQSGVRKAANAVGTVAGGGVVGASKILIKGFAGAGSAAAAGVGGVAQAAKTVIGATGAGIMGTMNVARGVAGGIASRGSKIAQTITSKFSGTGIGGKSNTKPEKIAVLKEAKEALEKSIPELEEEFNKEYKNYQTTINDYGTTLHPIVKMAEKTYGATSRSLSSAKKKLASIDAKITKLEK